MITVTIEISDLFYEKIGEISLAAKEIEKCVEISHGADPLDYYNIGVLHYKMQNYPNAENWFKRFVNEDPVRYQQYITNAKRIVERIKSDYI